LKNLNTRCGTQRIIGRKSDRLRFPTSATSGSMGRRYHYMFQIRAHGTRQCLILNCPARSCLPQPVTRGHAEAGCRGRTAAPHCRTDFRDGRSFRAGCYCCYLQRNISHPSLLVLTRPSHPLRRPIEHQYCGNFCVADPRSTRGIRSRKRGPEIAAHEPACPFGRPIVSTPTLPPLKHRRFGIGSQPIWPALRA
jgi:hypothetical protein